MLISLLILALVAIAAYVVITRFFPAGLPQQIALVVAGILLLIYLLQMVGVPLGGKLL